MNDNNHPSLDTLKHYALQPEAEEFSAISLHLVTCLSCRQQLQTLERISAAGDDLMHQSDENLQADIQDYIEGRAENTKDIENTINNNKDALNAALHYACSSSAMHGHIQDSAMETSNVEKKSSIKFFQLFRYQAPVWLTFPAGALASLFLVWLLMPILFPSSEYQLIAYQDDPQIEFQENNIMPGMGFFRSVKKQYRAFDSVNIQLIDNKKIHIQWPPVEDALSYTMKLYTFDKGEKRSLGKISTQQPSAIFETRSLQLKRRYEWVLSGTSRDHMQFNAAGGFIIY